MLLSSHFRRFSALGALTGFLFAAPDGAAAQGGADSPWTIEADTGLESGNPAIQLTLEPGHLLPRATVSDLVDDAVPDRPIAPRYLGEGTFRFEFPTVAERSYLAMVLTDPVTGSDEVFRWQVLCLPEGEPLLRHTGRQEMLPPDDFDEFWAAAKAELSGVPLVPVVTLQEGFETETGQLFRVELPTVRDTTIVAWCVVPKDAIPAFLGEEEAPAPLPAVIIMPGYGAQQPPLDRTADGFITLSVNPRNHGPSRDYWTAPVEHLQYYIDSPEDFYYRLAFLDCLRAAEWLYSLDVIDEQKVVAEGGSQGGLFAIALAMLEPRIAAVLSNVTAFSNYPEGMHLATIGHMTGYRTMLETAEEEGDMERAAAIRRSLALTDGVNLVTRLTQPLQVNMGGLDGVCPYSSGIVVVNRAPSGVPTEYNVLPNARHEVPGAMRQKNAEWVAHWLGLEEVPSFPGHVMESPWQQ